MMRVGTLRAPERVTSLFVGQLRRVKETSENKSRNSCVCVCVCIRACSGMLVAGSALPFAAPSHMLRWVCYKTRSPLFATFTSVRWGVHVRV